MAKQHSVAIIFLLFASISHTVCNAEKVEFEEGRRSPNTQKREDYISRREFLASAFPQLQKRFIRQIKEMKELVSGPKSDKTDSSEKESSVQKAKEPVEAKIERDLRLHEDENSKFETSTPDTSHNKTSHETNLDARVEIVNRTSELDQSLEQTAQSSKPNGKDEDLPAVPKQEELKVSVSMASKSSSLNSTLPEAVHAHKEIIEDSGLNTTQEGVNIGEAWVPWERVTKVGDIDNNGQTDYVVTNPSADNNAGSIRLYLMGEGNKFLYTRDLVPGMWGFHGAPLKPGDKYGSGVYHLSKDDIRAHTVIAVNAPGDRSMSKGKGAFYILKLSDKGNVLQTKKISANDFSALIVEQEKNNVAVGNSGKAHEELKKILVSLEEVTTMLLLNDDGGIKAALRVTNDDKETLIQDVQAHVSEQAKRKSIWNLGLTSLRPAVPNDHCYFSETHCACTMRTPAVGSMSCLEPVGSEPETGKPLCTRRDCKSSYACSCDGTDFCERVTRSQTIYEAGGAVPGGGGNEYCTSELGTIVINVLLPGEAVPQLPESNVPSTFNETHCQCSLKADVVEVGICFDFVRTEGGADVCRRRDCKAGSDAYVCNVLGESYCERTFSTATRYVSDGERPGEPDMVNCHKEEYEAEKGVKISGELH